MLNEKQLKCHENSPEGTFLLFVFQIIYFFFKICTYSCDVFHSRSSYTFDPSVDPQGDTLKELDANSASTGKKRKELYSLPKILELTKY